MRDDPFGLFCIYYLGLTRQGEYRFVNANQIARQLNWTVADLLTVLAKHGLHPDTVLNTDFQLARHQIDIQLAAEVETVEQLKLRAIKIYEQFRLHAGKRRDWLREIAEEQEQERRQKGS
jgi:alpha-D-ribose 1-methylphosphonate 5-triphosphate diphosphatase PhnM